MMQTALIGVGAGAAGALLFASVSSGSWLSVVLFYLAPLPMMIAGLGWSHWAALTGALAGAVSIGAAFGSMFFIAFLAGTGLPAWWLSYLAMLARPAGDGHTPLEWYPPGHLVFWAALLGALLVLAAIPNFGLSGEAFHAALSEKLMLLFRDPSTPAADAPLIMRGVSDPKALVDFLAEAVPPAAAVIATITNAVNLWLAGRVVAYSGRLARPWPTLADMRLPTSSAAALALAVALSFASGMLGIIAGVTAASLLMAYGILGFAILHAITRGLQARGLLLGSAYGAVLVLGWPLLALCLLGLADVIFDLRGRIARKRGRPT